MKQFNPLNGHLFIFLLALLFLNSASHADCTSQCRGEYDGCIKRMAPSGYKSLAEKAGSVVDKSACEGLRQGCLSSCRDGQGATEFFNQNTHRNNNQNPEASSNVGRRHIDYLNCVPWLTPKTVKVSKYGYDFNDGTGYKHYAFGDVGVVRIERRGDYYLTQITFQCTYDGNSFSGECYHIYAGKFGTKNEALECAEHTKALSPKVTQIGSYENRKTMKNRVQSETTSLNLQATNVANGLSKTQLRAELTLAAEEIINTPERIVYLDPDIKTEGWYSCTLCVPWQVGETIYSISILDMEVSEAHPYVEDGSGPWIVSITGRADFAGIAYNINRRVCVGHYQGFVYKFREGGAAARFAQLMLAYKNEIKKEISPAHEESGTRGLSVKSSQNATYKSTTPLNTQKRPWLGVQIQELNPELADYFGLKASEGVIVTGVMKNQPADKAGVQRNDIITTINDQIVTSPKQLAAIVANMPIDRKTILTLIRDGEKKSINIIWDVQTDSLGTTQKETENHILGVQVAEATPELARQYRGDPDCKGIYVINVC